MKIRCLLVDDEPLAIQLLQNHLEKLDMFEVVAKCSNAIKALEVLRTETIDLIFLDIKMPQISGIDFLKTLRNPPSIIVTTAYREYALDGYDLDIVDYLLKPITFDRFFKAVDRYLRMVQIPSSIPVLPLPDQFICIKSGGKFHKVPVDDILYIESLKDYITLHCTHQKITTKYKISDMESELKAFRFLRIHRSFIVNQNKITAFTVHDVEIGKLEIPIGTNYKEYVFQILKSNYSSSR